MRRLGRYELVDELGRGGAAIVYLARDTATDRVVAVKVLAPHLTRQGDVMARFQREIKLAVQLEHPHIVPIFDVGIDDDQPYIVLRLLSGGSLADRIQQGPVPVFAALAILQQVAAALDAAHRLKIIHRDVKPSNILFDLSGTAYLTDFGIAKAIDAVTTAINTWVVGTPAFMSPEQLREQPIDARTDEYALGIVAFTMLTGRLPYEGTTAHIITQQLIEPLPNARLINPQLPASIQGVLERATAKDPALRYASAGEFVVALDDAAKGWLALGGTTPVLDATELAAGRPAPDEASEPPPPARLSLNPEVGLPDARANHDTAVAARRAEPAPSAPAARRWRWPWLAALAVVSVAVALFAGWQLGAFAGGARVTPSPTDGSPTVTSGPAGTQSAASLLTPSTTGAPFMVTLAPDAIGLAIITLPAGTSGAALRTSPTGETILTLPDRTIVQVLRGRQTQGAAGDSVWVVVRAPNGEKGWVAEALLNYLNPPTAVLTPGGATPNPLTPRPAVTTQPAATSRQPTSVVTNGASTGTIQPATARPGQTGTAPPTHTTVPPTQPPTATQPAPANTAPPPTSTTAPSNSPAPTNIPASPTAAPSSTRTPVPSNTPIIQLTLPTLIPTLPLP